MTKVKLMPNHQFTLREGTPFIALDKLLKLMRIVGSGGEAHALTQDGMVQLNGEVETQKRKKIQSGDRVEFNGETIKVV
jgi:ribosome-associated protein